MDSHNIESDRELFLKALLHGSKRDAKTIADQYHSSHEEIKLLYEQVVKPALYQIGSQWENNLITVAAEHLATSISEMIMNDLYEYVISLDRVNKKILLACVENEYHQVGIKMIGDVFEMHGWDTFFLGANIPSKELIDFAIDQKIQMIGLSLSIYFHMDTLFQMIEEIQSKIPNVMIFVGGQAFTHGGKELLLKYERVVYLEDINQIETFIQKL